MRRLKNTFLLVWAIFLVILAPLTFILFGSGMLDKVAKHLPIKERNQWSR